MPKRQDSITKLMVNWLINSVQGKDPHCFTHTVIDFFIMGIQTGWQGVEWAQPKRPIKHGFFFYNKTCSTFENRIYALCIKNITFKYASNRIVTNPLTVADANVTRTVICWRYQKNLNHVQKIEFETSPTDQKFCFVLAALCVHRRFVLLCGKPNTPVAMYRKNANSRSTWLVKRSIELKLRMAAWKVFYPEEKKIKGSLANITLHSICIKVVMLLFKANVTNIQVMGRLRYKSTSFQMYYHNTPTLVKIHAKAIESSDNYTSSPAVMIDNENFEEDKAD